MQQPTIAAYKGVGAVATPGRLGRTPPLRLGTARKAGRTGVPPQPGRG